MSQQKVYGNVGQMIGRDIVVNYNNMVQGEIDTPIEHTQREQLNALLNDIANLTSGNQKLVWHRLHTTINVNKNNQNSSVSPEWSESFLLFENKKSKEINSRNILTDKIQQITNTSEKKLQRNKLCLDIFGTSKLAKLTLEQLQSVYYFIDLGFSLCEFDCKNHTEKTRHFFNPVYVKDIKTHEIIRYPSLINNIFFILGCLMGFISIIIAKTII